MRGTDLGRLFAVFLFSCCLLLLADGSSVTYAQDIPPDGGAAPLSPAGAREMMSEVTPDGYTVWRQQIDSGCSYADHSYTLDVPMDPAEMSDISYSMTNFDVDYSNAQDCEAGPEVDIMSLNGSRLGILTGANNSWSTNSWPLKRSQVISGTNQIFIDTDASGSGCWCVGVGYIEIRAKLGFKVVAHTPQKDDKNRDFHAGLLDLTVSFSAPYDTGTLTQNTFKLEYRSQGGGWQQVPGKFVQLGPDSFRFVPDADLKDGVRYRATVKGGSSGVKSNGGDKLDGDTVWYFWTVPDLDRSDAFDYGSGSVCPPSAAPCPGLELTIFQVARNATMVPNKPGIARIYLRWKKHTDVLDADQVKQMEVEAGLYGDGRGFVRATAKRPDKYSGAERQAAANSVNLYFTPGDSFAYTVEVTPQPQTNANIVKYTTSLTLPSSGRSPDLRFNYYFLKDGEWAGGAPADVKTAGRDLFTKGVEFMKDVFPVVAASYTEQGDYSIGYTRLNTMTDTVDGCGVVYNVACPAAGGGTQNRTELRCILNSLESMRGGKPLVAATVPGPLCPGVNGMRKGKVFVHFSGSGANYGTVVHETGHVFNLRHVDTANNIEGFQVRTGVNRSFVENPSSLESLMHTFGKPAEKRWIDNTQYGTLIGTVTAAGTAAEAAAGLQPAAVQAGPYLIVSGYIFTATNTVELAPAFLQDAPNDPPAANGPCSVQLLDGANAVLASDFAQLASPVEITPADPNAAPIETVKADPFFSVSLPWSNAAAKLRIACGATVLLTKTRSANAPAVNFSNVSDGATLSGSVPITWTGSDANGDSLAYQLQFSDDNGATWTPLMPLAAKTGLTLDTTSLPSGPNRKLRILASDGFNTSFAVRTVTLSNPLTALGFSPSMGETGVPIDSTVAALFASDVLTATLVPGVFKVYEAMAFDPLPGALSYDAGTRMVTFKPAERLKGNTTYQVFVSFSLEDVNGNQLDPQLFWEFTTGADASAPYIVTHHPAADEIDTPTNTLVQVDFSEDMKFTTLNPSSLRLLDAGSNVIAANVSYDPERRTAVLIPNANLQPNAQYQVSVGSGVQDIGGNALGAAYQWSFTTGATQTLNGIRIVGNYSDSGIDQNGDGLYERLRISVDVEVRNPSYYNLNGRLTDRDDRLILWATTGDTWLEPGFHTLLLDFDSVPIRSHGVDGSYYLDALNFYNAEADTIFDRRFRAFQTFPYDVEKFFSILTLGGLPGQLLEVNTTRDNAFNLRSFTTHSALPVTAVTYSILINTDPNVGVTIDANANIDINPPANTEAQSDVTIEARDPAGNSVQSSFRISVQRAQPAELAADLPLKTGTNATLPLAVQIRDQFGRSFTQQTTVTATTTLGAVDPPVVTTTSGAANFTFLAGGTPGVAFINLTTVGVSKLISVEVAAEAPAALEVQAEPNSILADGASTAVIRATVRDGLGSAVPNQQVSFATTLGGITPAATTGADGVATATLTAGTAAGAAQVTAALGGLTGGVTVQLVEPTGLDAFNIYLPAVSR